MSWIEPIYDRQQSDIDEKTSKAYLNYDDLNRIEDDIEFLANIFGTTHTKTTWTRESVPKVENFATILLGLARIKAKVADSPSLPSNPINTYQKVNEIEYFLYFVYNYYREKILTTIQPISGFYCANEPLVIMAERS